MDDELADWLLYQTYDWHGRPVRYGITSRTFAERLDEYRRDRDHGMWVRGQMDSGRTAVTELGHITKAEARDIERDHIRADEPMANHEHHPNPQAQAEYFDWLRSQGAATAEPWDIALPLDRGQQAAVSYALPVAVACLWLLFALIALARTF